MKIRSVTVLACMVFCAMSCDNAKPPADPMAVVETEHTFAALAAEQGMKEAFVAFADDEGIMFNPAAVNVKEYYADREGPTALLSWDPIYAELAGSGDLGFATGPWEYRVDPEADKADVFGHYVSIWKRQVDSSYKFVIDIGISHAAHDSIQPGLATRVTEALSTSEEEDAGNPSDELVGAEYVLSSASGVDGAAAAYAPLVAEDVRLYRDGQKPIQGVAAVTGALGQIEGVWSWEPITADVSTDRTFGYVHGTGRLVQAETVQLFNYVRIWRKDKAGNWRIALDIHVPLPAPTEEATP